MARMIQVEALWHTYLVGTPWESLALRGVSLEVEEGEVVGIMGATGSGKSTLVQHLNGLLRPQKGKVLISGLDLSDPRVDVREKVGLVFQNPEDQLFAPYVGEDIAFGPLNYGISGEELRERVRWAMEAVRLDLMAFKDRPIFALSVGERRRVALAGVLALMPQILVLDEPTAGLDPAGRKEILQLLRELNQNQGITLVIVSHNLEDVAGFAHRVLVLVSGESIYSGLPRELLSQPEILQKGGLGLPLVTQVMQGLRKRGAEVRADIVSAEEAAQEIARLWQIPQPVKTMESGSSSL